MNHRYLALVLIILTALFASLSSSCGSADEDELYGPPQVTFPGDEGAHADALVEWWYLNARLQDSEGKEYTAMVSYFTPAMRVMSISDLETNTFYQDAPKISDLLFTTKSYAEGAFDIRWGETDRWYRTDSDSPSYRLKSKGENISLDLGIVSEKAPLMVGGDGLIEWTKGSTYYYSLTRLQVEGQIEFAGKVVAVEGTGWMDHQWMEEALQIGWDWFSIQLDNDTDIICWQIFTDDGLIQTHDMTIMFSDESIYHTVDLDIEMVSSWTSPETDEVYGIAWRITEAEYDLDLEVTSQYSEQEILMFIDQPIMAWQFWEGGVTVSGKMAGGDISGIGYAELVPPLTFYHS